VSLSPTRGSEVRNYCRRLRAERPQITLLVLRPLPTDVNPSRSAERMKEAGANIVVTTIEEALRAIEALVPSVDAECVPYEETNVPVRVRGIGNQPVDADALDASVDGPLTSAR
jgi:hypothetical protein